MTRSRVGLVLGAGGVAGHAFHAGVLRAIAEATGWDPREAEIVVGTSAGSVLGFGLRVGIPIGDIYARVVGQPASVETEELLAALPEREAGHYPLVDSPRRPLPASPRLLARLAVQPWRARLGLLTAAALPEGRRDASPISDEVELLLRTRRVTDPFWVTAVRLDTAERVVFGRDDTGWEWTWGDAVAASCAIPSFFAPVRIGGVRLVDGGAHSSTNADLLADAGLDTVVVLAPMSSVRSAAFRGIDAPFRALQRLRLAAEVAVLRRHGAHVVVFQPTADDLAVMGLNAMDPECGPRVAHQAFESARRRLDRTPHLFPLRAGVA